jgi:YVTN family beta-propeller protein
VITDPRIGTELAGYRIESLIGRGGMSVVYLATDTRLKRRLALKLLSPELAEGERFRERFVRESQLAASLDHPNVIPIFEAGEAEGVLYIAMRYVEGTDLKVLIETEGSLTPERTIRLLHQVGAALDAAHARGLIHRDVKPANILIAGEARDHVYLSDFGLTKRSTSESGLTGTGQFVGTFDYAAPEQFEGKPMDARTDVYSLGCVLYECLTGEAPFHRDNEAALVYAHLMAPPPEVTGHRPELPKEIDGVVGRAMSKVPGDRYPSAGELVDAVRTALGPVTAPERSVPPPVPRTRPRRWPLLAGAGALAVVLALVAALLVARRGTPTASPSPATSPSGPVVAEGDRVVRISQAGTQAGLAQPTPIEVGRNPSAVTVGEGSVWVANAGDGTVSRIDPVSGEARTIEVGPRPVAITFGEGSVWVVNRLSRSVSRIDPGTNRVVATIEVSGAGLPSSIAAAGGAVWVATDSGFPLGETPPTIHRIDPTSNDEAASIPTPTILWVVLAADEEALWVAGNDGRLMRIDPETNALDQVASLGIAAGAMMVNGGSVWIATVPGEVLKIDPASGHIEARAPGGGSPFRCGSATPCGTGLSTLGIAAGEGLVWVTDKVNGGLSRILAAGDDALDPIPVGQTPTGVAVAYGSVWVTVDTSG